MVVSWKLLETLYLCFLMFDKVHNPSRLPQKRYVIVKKCSKTVSFLLFDLDMCFALEGVHFLDILTSNSGPMLLCVAHFYFDMFFAPQRRALFRRLNF